MDVVVGRVAKAHGVSGELAVDVRTDSPEQRFAERAVLRTKLRDGTFRDVTVNSARAHGERLLVRFAEVVTRDAAETLRGALLFGETESLQPIDDPDEFYDHELEGLHVQLADGSPVGIVRDIVHSPAGEHLAVECNEDTVLVPFVRAIVPEVDLSNGLITVDPPEGLFDARYPST